MNTQNNGGPAFPVTPDNDVRMNQSGGTGMTLRDYFAAKVMQGFVTSAPWEEAFDHLDSAKTAYEIADAMLAAREES
ncbi:hypothetical protein HNO91_11970 [Pseudomonas corrugata]|uniref:Uncharacterized protein n=1 Tax=Pseudomonas corrugata TaxID=47879 RepID=A0A7Y5Z5K5_9PSED|nr:hypothetical protein [Pseudomonas corrugata]NUT87144.1 hypothetical protein [Pseudomonas corrugata]